VLRTIIESEAYRRQFETLGDAARLDDILTGVTWALSTNPEVYEVVKGLKDIRLLKTDAFPDAPPLRIWFRIDEGGQHVHLEAIEAMEIES
jgi:hypothetical protein